MINYCFAPNQTKRRKTREVKVGEIGVGGQNPVRIQSMTTSNTRDVDATVDQAMRLADAGCEIVRCTVQGIKEAEACEAIKNNLLQKGYRVPIVADIHFYPPAAMRVIEFVDKVRINPGNFVDKRAIFKQIDYDDAAYAAEIQKIEDLFAPLVEKAKKLGKALRIGTNHGSLSDRIMNRYGDTPFGMVESALEFARVCRKYDYHDIIFSMKASNPLVMIQAYRLLVAEMNKLDWDYPLHLGVTEAGEGEDGRIKSGVGIGSLLLDGLGDTIRVSLTEDPWNEIDPCKRLISFAASYEGQGIPPFTEKERKIDAITRRKPSIQSLPLHRDGSCILKLEEKDLLDPNFYERIGCKKALLNQWERGAQTVDAVFVERVYLDQAEFVKKLKQVGVGFISRTPIEGGILLKELKEILPGDEKLAVRVTSRDTADWKKLLTIKNAFILFSPYYSRIHEGRRFYQWLIDNGVTFPLILDFEYNCSWEDLIIYSSSEMGALLADGIGEGVCIEAPYDCRAISFSILQAARMRQTKTDFISCPGCGRTLFDLQEVTQKIKKRTDHLPGVKIAIMGCIVNGPGEMADADFGYVGSKPGKIDLYVGKTCVEKDIPFAEAEEKLIELIKSHGRWVENPIVQPSVN